MMLSRAKPSVMLTTLLPSAWAASPPSSSATTRPGMASPPRGPRGPALSHHDPVCFSLPPSGPAMFIAHLDCCSGSYLVFSPRLGPSLIHSPGSRIKGAPELSVALRIETKIAPCPARPLKRLTSAFFWGLSSPKRIALALLPSFP